MKISTAISFMAGALSGAGIMYVYLKKKYTDDLNNEITSVKEALKKHYDCKNKEHNEKVLDKAEEIIQEQRYTNYAKIEERREEEEANTENPYIIDQEAMGEIGYSELSLTYYADGVLTDENDDILDDDDILDYIGTEWKNHFIDDAVYIRNEKMRCDYEILKDNRVYSSFHNFDD